MALIGKVVSITGEAYLVPVNGTRRALQLGDLVQTGDTVETARGAEVELELVNGRMINIRSEQSVLFTEELSQVIAPSGFDSAVNLATIETVIKAIEEGKDINAVLEETAAGQAAAFNTYGFSFVDLFRINDILNAFNFAYDYQPGQIIDIDPLADGDDNTYLGLGLPAAGPAPSSNLAPTASFTSTAGVEDTTNATLNLTGTDADGSIASIRVLTLPSAAQGVLYLADGVTPVVANSPLTPAQATGLIFVAAPNFNGTVNIPFNVTDDGGTTSSVLAAQVSFSAVNDAPVANDDNVAVTEDTAVVGNVLNNDADVEGNALSVTQFTVDTNGDSIPEVFAAGSTAVIAGIGTIVINANGSYTFTPALNYTGVVPAIVYTMSDGSLTDTGGLNLGPITAINDAPTANPIAPSGNEDSNIAINLSGSDADGTIVAVRVLTLPLTTQGTLYLADGVTPVVANSALTPAQAAGLIFTPALNFNGTVNIPFNVTDNGGATSTTAAATITVNA
ncbi:MAG: retention module-containing protein, partial [Pseudomonadota bacterium]